MSDSEYEDGSGDDRQDREADSLDDLRVRRRKSAVLLTVLTVAVEMCIRTQ
jgi:hypothetical protein